MEAISTYPQWRAPAGDGELLIWPEPATLVAQTAENHVRLSSAPVLIQNVPLMELRTRQRQFLGHVENERPLVGTGHQTELHHPGVWVKDVLSNLVASKLDGVAYHFAVDTDSPKHLNLRWPRPGQAGAVECPITDDPSLKRAEWTGLLDAPTPGHLAQIESALADARFSFKPVIGEFLTSLRGLSLETPKLSAAL